MVRWTARVAEIDGQRFILVMHGPYIVGRYDSIEAMQADPRIDHEALEVVD